MPLILLRRARRRLWNVSGDNFVVDWIDQGQAMPIKFVFEGHRAIRIDWDGRIFERVP